MTLVDRLEASVQAIKTPDKEDAFKSFWHNWRGTGDGNDGNTPCIALVEYAKSVGCNKDDDSLKTQLGELEKLVGGEKELDAGTLLSLLVLDVRNGIAEWQEHLTLQLRAIAATVRAATLWGSDKEQAKSQLQSAAGALNKAFPLSAAGNFVPIPGASDPAPNSANAIPLLHAALVKEAPMLPSTYLWLAWLLRHLFRKEQPSASSANPAHPVTSNRVKMLLAKSTGGGVIARVQFDAWHEEAVGGLFFCPLALGVTPVDPKMTESARLAGRVTRQSLDSWLEEKYHGHRAVRIAPELPFGAVSLKGPSAGGLLAGAALMTAMGKTLDTTRTASVSLKLTAAGEAKKESDDLKPEELELASVGSVAPKLDASGYADAEIKGVALHPNDVDQWKNGHPNSNLTVQPVSSLAELFRFLQGDAWYEDLLKYHAADQAKVWEQIKGSENAADKTLQRLYDEHRLDHYVPPAFRMVQPKKRASSSSPPDHAGEIEEIPVTDADDGAFQQVWKSAIDDNKNLFLYDNAGSGKTVTSLRWVRVLTHDDTAKGCQGFENDRHRLVVRWEGGWPGDSLGTLRHALENDPIVQAVARDSGTAHGMVDYALQNRRVVIILDGFDQFSTAARRHVVDLINHNRSTSTTEAADQVRWIITAREHIFDELRQELFRDHEWLRIKIDGFDEDRQDRYFKDFADRDPSIDWRATLVDPDGTDELLRLPMVLRMIRRLIEERSEPTSAGQPVELPKFESLSDLFAQVARLLLERATNNLDFGLQKRQQELGLNRDAAQELLGRVIGLLAFQMQLESAWDGRFTGGPAQVASSVRKLKLDAAGRFLWQADQELALPNLPHSQRRLREREIERELDRWEWAIRVLETIETSHRTVNEIFQTDRIQFRSRKVMEGYAALFLSRFATSHDLVGNDDPADRADPAAWSRIADPQWTATWRMVIEMPRRAIDEATSDAAIGLLFRRVRGGPTTAAGTGGLAPARSPEPELRPTELIVRAWHFMTRSGRPGIDRILATYREQFIDILNGSNLETARLAAELVPFWLLEKWEKHQALPPGRAAQLKPQHAAYVRIPVDPSAKTWTGKIGEWNGITERSGQPFWFATCCVTRAQYRLFCAALEKQNESDFSKISPEEDCPVIMTSWWDSVALGLWLGEGIAPPDRTHWEIAARGGRTDPNDFVGVPPYNETFTTDRVNFGGYYQIQGAKYLNRTLPVRWDAARHALAIRARSGAAELPPYQPNGFGIWHANGNVWEWCLNDGKWSQATDVLTLHGLTAASLSAGRVAAGGSWRRFAVDARSAGVFHNVAGRRRDLSGVRLCVVVGRVASASSEL